ncbi:MAG TPA: oligosaccharide flippase family protein [Fervidobacterium sp.]|nr:oligosaccharide flippase family protein [Fervidobacterium sp.]
MFREFFEKDDEQYKYNVTTTTARIVLASSTIISLVLLIFNSFFSKLFFDTSQYRDIVIYSSISLIFSANTSIIQAPTRILNKRKVYVFSGLFQSILSYAISIPLIIIGFSYYGIIYSSLVTGAVMLIFFWFQNKKFFLSGTFDKKIAKELFKIGLPLVPTFLIYWIYNSTDRIMITNMLGTSQLGIYSIGARLAQISQLIYSAFAGGWQYFAFSTMRDEDQVDLVSRIFEYLGIISFVAFLAIVPFNNLIFSLLFKGDYIKGSTVFPYLFLSPLLLMLFQTAGNQFLVIKKSYLATMSLAVGAGTNVLLNYLLIPRLGIVGASIATLIGYTMSVIIVAIINQKMGLLKVKFRFILSALLVALDFVAIGLSWLNLYLINLLLVIAILLAYKQDVELLIRRVTRR